MKYWFFILLLPALGHAIEFESQGEIRFKGGSYLGPSQNFHESGIFSFSPKLELKLDEENWSGRFSGYGQLHANSTDRDDVFLESAWLGHQFESSQLRFGYQIFNWSTNDVFNPTDFLNSQNLDGDIERLDKLGELSASYSHDFDETNVSLFFLPTYVAPNFPAPSSRLNLSRTELQKPLWIHWNGLELNSRYVPQGGVRVTQNFGDAEASLFSIAHLDRRRSLFYGSVNSQTFGQIHPVFLPTLSSGGSYLHILGPLTFRLEGLYKKYLPSSELDLSSGLIQAPNSPSSLDHGILAPGVEYGWSFENGWDSTLILETQAVVGLSKSDRALTSVFQRDAALTYRLTFNDDAGTEGRATLITDLERTREKLLALSFSRRILEDWRLKTSGRVVVAPNENQNPAGLELLRETDEVSLQITRFF